MGDCVRPGCPGSYRPDGFCDECGRAVPTPGRTPPRPGERPAAERIAAEPIAAEPTHESRGASRYPPLRPGETLGERYAVIERLAYGGLGHIYLAHDTKLDREVVLKGLIDPGDPDAVEAVLREKKHLVGLSHDDIVRIHDFVTRPEPGTGASTGYIVMEYLPGKSLFDVRRSGPLQLDAALAYCAAVLPAFAYLHDRGILHCDLKPGNIMLVGKRVKLIDLGAARRADDTGPRYYTRGYRSPELAPSVESDLYSLGRTLAVLTLEFDNIDRYEFGLPPPGEAPPLARWESFHRLLLKATDPDPRRRFGSAVAMRHQILGVLREVVAHGTGEPRPGPATVFVPVRRVFAASVTDPVDWSAVTEALPVAREGWDRDPRWWSPWTRGMAALDLGDPATARTEFDQVYSELPGELAPRLALALASEWIGDDATAAEHYERVWATDREYHTAAFGLARVRLRAGAYTEAVTALDQVPEQSVDHLPAQIAAIRVRLAEPVIRPDPEHLIDAGDRVERLPVGDRRATALTIDVLAAALEWVRARPGSDERSRTARLLDKLFGEPPSGPTVLGVELAERPIRYGLEAAYRTLAGMTHDRVARRDLIAKANQVRPWTGV